MHDPNAKRAAPRRVPRTTWLSLALAPLTVVVLGAGSAASDVPAKATTLLDEAVTILDTSETARTVEQAARWQKAVARARTAVDDAHGDLGAVATAVATLAGPSGRAYARWTSPVDPLRGWLASATRSTVPAHSGMTLTRRGAKWFVTEVIAGSPAAKAGFLRGDEVLATTSHPDGELVGRAEATLRRRRFAGEAPVDVKIVPTTESWTSLVAAELAKAPTLINSGNQRVAVLKWPELTDESLRAPAFAALGRARDQGRAIVLDLRGERGFGGVTWLEPFLGTPGDDQAPAGSSLPSSEAGASLAPAAAAAHWALHIAQPMVAVVDGTTHGGRELLARVLARSGRARLVGRETAGRVAPEKVHALPSGSVLVLATPAPVGLDLRPVAPDEVVEDNLAYAAGRDPLLEHAVQVAAAAAEASSAAKAGASPRRQGH